MPLPGPLPSPLGGSDDQLAHSYASMMQKLLPPGRLWNLLGDTWLGRFFLAAADELVRVHNRAIDLLFEADPTMTGELLPEWERALDVPPAAGDTGDSRRAHVVSRLVSRQRLRPRDFQVALATILGLAIDDVEVHEQSRAHAVAVHDDREIFRFRIFRDWTAPGSYDLIAADALILKIKPSATTGRVYETKAILCDNPHSLCDRDTLGV